MTEENTQDIMVLIEYYRKHKPELASTEKVEKVISTFQAKAAKEAKASINSIGPSWREMMYESIAKRSGVDPREYFDLTVGSTVAMAAAARQRQRTEAAMTTRRLAWEESQADQNLREKRTALDTRQGAPTAIACLLLDTVLLRSALQCGCLNDCSQYSRSRYARAPVEALPARHNFGHRPARRLRWKAPDCKATKRCHRPSSGPRQLPTWSDFFHSCGTAGSRCQICWRGASCHGRHGSRAICEAIRAGHGTT